ncbi:hypothetical protein CIG75_19280 [Tumebacillus algifaecis]|uniref:HTH cro/C1-type domain-containing protein n=1 Tax=Tumebacillus algifaecis TaxID=1214604 RepID=A0A223D5W5_9BACL|nr:transcriptional regulator [Tumebacillus algifaecis]ASS76877.1 hypothetical protein CIG75_19280 [Tumebacillus algifaecis]
MKFDNAMPMRVMVGRNVQRARIMRGYKSARQLAEKLSFSHTKLSNIESGKTVASASDLRELTEMLNVPVGYFYTDANDVQETMLIIESCFKGGSGDPLKAQELTEDLIARDLPDKLREYLLTALVRIMMLQGKHRKALELLEELLGEVSNVTSEYYFKTLYNIALCHYHLQDYHKALTFYRRAEQHTIDEVMLCRIKQMLGVIYGKIGDLTSALEMHMFTRGFYKEKRLLKDELQAIQNIGEIYERQGDFENATLFYQEANSIAFSLNVRHSIGFTGVSLAKLLVKQQRFNDASIIIRKCIPFVDKSYSPPHHAEFLFLLSQCETSNSTTLLEAAFSVSKHTDDHQLTARISSRLGEISEECGDNENALLYYKRASKSFELSKMGD